ncbi:hypothetical protein MCOR25_009630 [Pyricularia grisea]|nr:hypothetical protein MCOR25_009630 [Pyricularia grisea]
MIVPPLADTTHLLELPLDAGSGIIVASRLASCILAVASPLLSLVSSNIRITPDAPSSIIGRCAGCIGAP